MVIRMLPASVKNAVVRRKGKNLIGPVDLTLAETGVTIVIGPNGAGKTTLLRMLHGLDRMKSGTITWACPTSQARARQAFVFQQPVLMRRNVRDNIAYALQVAGISTHEARGRAEDWAAKVGLSGMLDLRASALSGGERQKMAIARALIRDPDVIFLDEPCSSLDGRATREIEEILKGAAHLGKRLIMSTHDMGQARRLASEVIFMLNGCIHEIGPAPDFFDNPQSAKTGAFMNGDIVE